jgi:hypothetical protein
MAWFTTTGSRPIGRWPEPSRTNRSAPVCRTTVSKRPTGWHLSSVPWTTWTGQSMLRSIVSASSTEEG